MSEAQILHYAILEMIYWVVFAGAQWVVWWKVFFAKTLTFTAPVIFLLILTLAGQMAVVTAQAPDLEATREKPTQPIDE